MDENTHPVAVRPRVTTPLKLALERAGVRQAWLAGRIGTAPTRVSDYVRGVHVPQASTRAAIVRELRRHPDLKKITEADLWPPQEQAA